MLNEGICSKCLEKEKIPPSKRRKQFTLQFP
jgi:hypothetical protein